MQGRGTSTLNGGWEITGYEEEGWSESVASLHANQRVVDPLERAWSSLKFDEVTEVDRWLSSEGGEGSRQLCLVKLDVLPLSFIDLMISIPETTVEWFDHSLDLAS